MADDLEQQLKLRKLRQQLGLPEVQEFEGKPAGDVPLPPTAPKQLDIIPKDTSLDQIKADSAIYQKAYPIAARSYEDVSSTTPEENAFMSDLQQNQPDKFARIRQMVLNNK